MCTQMFFSKVQAEIKYRFFTSRHHQNEWKGIGLAILLLLRDKCSPFVSTNLKSSKYKIELKHYLIHSLCKTVRISTCIMIYK